MLIADNHKAVKLSDPVNLNLKDVLDTLDLIMNNLTQLRRHFKIQCSAEIQWKLDTIAKSQNVIGNITF